MPTASSLRLKINNDGIRELLGSAVVQDDLKARGDRIAAAAGGGHAVTATTNRDRAVVFVTTTTHEARKAEAEDRALTRAIDSGR